MKIEANVAPWRIPEVSVDTHDEHYSEESQSTNTPELPESTIKNLVIKKLLKGIFLCYVVIWNQKETSPTYCLNTARTVVGHKLIFLFFSFLFFFDRNWKLEMGLKFEEMEKSNSSFWWGRGGGCLKAAGTQPDISEELIRSTIHGPTDQREKAS